MPTRTHQDLAATYNAGITLGTGQLEAGVWKYCVSSDDDQFDEICHERLVVIVQVFMWYQCGAFMHVFLVSAHTAMQD